MKPPCLQPGKRRVDLLEGEALASMWAGRSVPRVPSPPPQAPLPLRAPPREEQKRDAQVRGREKPLHN